MLTACQLCKKEIDVGEAIVGQHIKCPYCGGKFEFDGKGFFGKEVTVEDLRRALAECRQDEKQNRLYSNAPAGARLFIILLFYGKIFKNRLDLSKYLEAFADIETELEEGDARYLIEGENDSELVSYYRELIVKIRQRSASSKNAEVKGGAHGDLVSKAIMVRDMDEFENSKSGGDNSLIVPLPVTEVIARVVEQEAVEKEAESSTRTVHQHRKIDIVKTVFYLILMSVAAWLAGWATVLVLEKVGSNQYEKGI